MIWIAVAVVVCILLVPILWLVVKTRRARRYGRVCGTCRFDSGDDQCLYGMGWEPQPALRWCKLWSPQPKGEMKQRDFEKLIMDEVGKEVAKDWAKIEDDFINGREPEE